MNHHDNQANANVNSDKNVENNLDDHVPLR